MTITSPPKSESDVRPVEPSRPRRRANRGRRFGAVALAIVAGVVLALVALRAFQPHLYAGTVLQGNTPAPPMEELVFEDGNPVDLAAFQGDLTMVYFGYTNCPDICPTTLAKAADALDSLDAGVEARVRLLLVSVDPHRDPPEMVGEYARFFHPNFTGASGSVAGVADVASQYGIYYQLGTGSDYTVDHSSSLMAIGPDGVLRIVWPPDVAADRMAADIAELLG